MDNEIDLRPYIELLIRRWYWIVGVAVLAGIAAFVVSSSLPPTYEATALVAVTQPRESVQFEPRIRTIEEDQPLAAFPELAISDTMMQELMSSLNPSANDIESLDDLREILEAEAGSDPSLLRLTVQFGDPEIAAEIANAWAALFVQRANAVFGDQNGTQVQFFEEQLHRANTELEAAEEALADFQGRNRVTIIDNQLETLQQTQADYLTSQQALTLLLQDLQGLRNQLAEQSGNGSATLVDQLTILSLQLKAFNAAFDDKTSVPLQLQIGASDDIITATRSEQIESLDGLLLTIEERLAEIDDEVAAIEPQILTLQQDKQETETENSHLIRDWTLADETYLSLARKVDEERISLDEITSGVRLASEAAVPEKSVGPRRLFAIFFAALLGFLLATVVVFALEWWQKGKSS